MPRPSVPGPDHSRFNLSPTNAAREQNDSFENDFAELTRNFALQAKGLSPELSADLALEIVLNEIVEQACFATGASGAAVALKRGNELVCRASSGITAPQLGSRLGMGQGLSGECIRTRQVQICDDTETDSRADAVAARQLGVRSVIVLPLLRGPDLVGILEAFSTYAAAFEERHRHILGTFGWRVLDNVERAANWPPAEVNPVPAAATAADKVHNDREPNFPLDPRLRPLADAARSDLARSDLAESIVGQAAEEPMPDVVHILAPSRAISILTWMLGAVVLLIAVVMTMLVAQHFGLHSAGARLSGEPAMAAAATKAPASSTLPSSSSDKSGSDKSGGDNLGTDKAGTAKPAPPGSLLVFENGKEVFRMMPQGASAKSAAPPSAPAQSIMELPPSEAEETLIRRVEPEYPKAARQQGIQGQVVLEVKIAQNGAVQDLRPVSGHPLLAEAAIAAVKQWKFKPHLVKGEPVEMQTRVTLNFRLPSDAAR